MDVIFCRNVLMYFAAAQAQQVVAQLRRCLIAGGWLALSATETSVTTAPHFAPVNFDSAILYRKGNEPPAPIPAPAVPAAAAMHTEAPLPAEAEQPRAEPPEEARETIRLTRERANQGRLAEALALADQLVLAEKMNPVARHLRAMILVERGALSEAAKELQRAIYLDHGFIMAYFSLGNLARGAGRLKEADRHFTSVLQLLDRCRPDDLLPESEGMTAGRLAEIVHSMREEVTLSKPKPRTANAF
jgi:chemotaxis protein methyltransferase CheR